jgi:cell division protease FtsH
MALPGTDPVHKVTIVPRGRALGLTWQLPERDRISLYKDQMLNEMSILFGGRIAEDLFVKRISTGASNDFERATRVARDMVTRYGMSELLGPMVYGENDGEVFLGRSVTTHKSVSEATMQKVDGEIRRIIDEQYALAQRILEENRDKVEIMTNALMEWETIDAEQVQDIMAGRPPRSPRPPAGLSTPSGDTPSGPAPEPTIKPAQEH